MYRLLIIWVGKLLLIITRWRGGGSALPGLVVEKLYPGFITTLRDYFTKVILVTGTNGKTTTSKMIRGMLAAENAGVLHNHAGSNMPRGIISSVLGSMDWRGRLRRDFGLFEVDEGFLPQVAEALKPDLIIVLNLHRDQLDRYGELDRIVKLLSSAIEHTQKMAVNRDDPRLMDLSESLGKKTLWFGGIQEVSSAMPNDDSLHSKATRQTSGQQLEAVVEIQAVKDKDDHQLIDVVVDNTTFQVELQLKGVFNAYNAAAALTAVYALGLNIETAVHALSKVTPAFGRSELLELDDDRKIQLLLVKNPSGFNHMIQSYLTDSTLNPVLILINDNYADGRDVSWLWDVGIEELSGSRKRYLTGGLRGSEMRLRLAYADLDSENYDDVDSALEDLITGLAPGETGYIVPTYTAMLDVRRRLRKYSDSVGEWK